MKPIDDASLKYFTGIGASATTKPWVNTAS